MKIFQMISDNSHSRVTIGKTNIFFEGFMKKFIFASLLVVMPYSVFSVEYNKVPKNIKCLKDLGITICRETNQEHPKYYKQYDSVVSCTKAALFQLTDSQEVYTYFKVVGLGRGTFSKTAATAEARGRMENVEKGLAKMPSCLTLFKK